MCVYACTQCRIMFCIFWSLKCNIYVWECCHVCMCNHLWTCVMPYVTFWSLKYAQSYFLPKLWHVICMCVQCCVMFHNFEEISVYCPHVQCLIICHIVLRIGIPFMCSHKLTVSFMFLSFFLFLCFPCLCPAACPFYVYFI